MNDSNYRKIFHGNFIIVQRIITDLEKENISAVVKEQTETGLLKSVYGGTNSDYQEIYVHKDELDKALSILENITQELQS